VLKQRPLICAWLRPHNLLRKVVSTRKTLVKGGMNLWLNTITMVVTLCTLSFLLIHTNSRSEWWGHDQGTKTLAVLHLLPGIIYNVWNILFSFQYVFIFCAWVNSIFQFVWRPYQEILPPIEEDTQCWSATTFLICFDIIEYHQTNRVKLQFELKQSRLTPPMNMQKYHKVTNCGQRISSWGMLNMHMKSKNGISVMKK
jgi:hypothetical protein